MLITLSKKITLRQQKLPPPLIREAVETSNKFIGVRGITLCMILLIFTFTASFAEEVEVAADELNYKMNYLIIASGNVELTYQQITLNANYAEIDTRTNEFIAIGGVDVVFEGNRFKTEMVAYKLKKDQMIFSALSATFYPKEFVAPLYFKSKIISKDGKYFQGKKASLSTCPYDKQYYVIEAERFKFYPDDKLVGYDVYCHSGPVPIFYSPYYEFAVGYRNPILLFPIIGNNLIEGNYLKTALDYRLNRDFRSLIYIDHMQNFGLGIGIDATIREDRVDPANAYMYYIDARNYAFKWDQSIKLPDETYQYGFHKRNLYRTTGAYDRFADGYISYSNKHVGNIYAYNKDDAEYSKKNEKYTWKGKIGDFNNNVSYLRDNYYNSGYDRNNFSFTTSTKGFNNRFSYNNTQYSNNSNYQHYNNNLNISPMKNLNVNADLTYKSDNNSLGNDELFTPKFIASYYLNNAPINLRAVSLKTNFFIDLDEDIVTEDDKLTILESLPEAGFSFNSFYYGIFRYTPSLTIGNYHERRYIDAAYGNRDITHKRVLLKNDINADLYKNDWSVFSVSYGYDQYIYDTQDKQYGLNEVYRLDIFRNLPMKNSTQFNQYHSLGYTPFYFDEMSSYKTKRLNNTFTYDINNNSRLIIRDGYDFEAKRRDVENFDYRYTIDNNKYLPCSLVMIM